MKAWKRFLRLFVMIILLFFFYYLVGFKYLTKHESIHQRIFRAYGINSTISIDYLRLYGNVTPETREGCGDSCITQHRVNDIVGYNNSVLIFCLFSLLFIYIVYKTLFETR